MKDEPDTLHERVVGAIKDYIMEHKLREGDRLPGEHRMAELLGVSRTSVREAMATLVALGIVEVQSGRGAFVRDFSLKTFVDQISFRIELFRDDLRELIEIRRLLEVYSLGRIGADLSERDLAALRDVVEKMRVKAAAGQDFIDEDIQFHSILAEAGGSRILKFILEGFWELQRKVRRVTEDLEMLSQRQKEHEDILKALEARDARGAEYFMHKHFDAMSAKISSVADQQNNRI